jgi:hypothetical protein
MPVDQNYYQGMEWHVTTGFQTSLIGSIAGLSIWNPLTNTQTVYIHGASALATRASLYFTTSNPTLGTTVTAQNAMPSNTYSTVSHAICTYATSGVAASGTLYDVAVADSINRIEMLPGNSLYLICGPGQGALLLSTVALTSWFSSFVFSEY